MIRLVLAITGIVVVGIILTLALILFFVSSRIAAPAQGNLRPQTTSDVVTAGSNSSSGDTSSANPAEEQAGAPVQTYQIATGDLHREHGTCYVRWSAPNQPLDTSGFGGHAIVAVNVTSDAQLYAAIEQMRQDAINDPNNPSGRCDNG